MKEEKSFVVVTHRTFSDYKDWWVFCHGPEKTPENLKTFSGMESLFEGGYNSGSPLGAAENWLDEIVKTKDKSYTVEVTIKIRETVKSDFDKATRD